MIIRLEIKNYNMILTEKQQKYQHCHLEKLINMNILKVKKYYLIYHFKGATEDIYFNDLFDAETLFNDIRSEK